MKYLFNPSSPFWVVVVVDTLLHSMFCRRISLDSLCTQTSQTFKQALNYKIKTGNFFQHHASHMCIHNIFTRTTSFVLSFHHRRIHMTGFCTYSLTANTLLCYVTGIVFWYANGIIISPHMTKHRLYVLARWNIFLSIALQEFLNILLLCVWNFS